MAKPQHYPLPVWSPFYDEPRHIFKGATLITILGRVRPGTLKDLVAYPLTPELANGEVFSLWLGKFDEVVFPTAIERNPMLFDIGMPTSYNGIQGRHCFLEYIDASYGIAAGRELWGWPKKHGTLSWVEHERKSHIEVKVGGYTLAMIDFVEGGELDLVSWPSIPGLGDEDPYLQVRPHGQLNKEGSLLVDVLTKDPEDTTVFRSANTGTATISFFDGPTDPISFLNPIEIVGARVDRYDFEFGPPLVAGTEEIRDPEAYFKSQRELALRLRKAAGFDRGLNPRRL